MLYLTTLMGMGLVPGCATVPTYRGALESGRLRITIGEFELTAGERRAIFLVAPELGDTIILIRDGGDEFRALSATCTHQKCRVRPATHALQCPCHGSTYDFEGKVLRGPAKRGLASYPVTVKDNQIEVDVNVREDDVL